MLPVQEKELGVLKEVIKVIENNGLHYCAIGGTCLGAVRHKGFIPWDDDIDITLPRKEYERFRTELYKQLPAPLEKMDCDVACSHGFVFMKIHDSSTTQIETYATNSPDRITGAFVDIFPLDGVPEGKWKRKKWMIKYQILVRANYARRIDKIVGADRLWKRIVSFPVKKCFRYNFFSDKFSKFAGRYNVDNCDRVHYNGYPYNKILEHTYTKKYFFDTVLAEFEDIKIKIPRQYDQYLTEKYGDYMALPPDEDRGNWHHVYISDMNKPCSYYAEVIREKLRREKQVCRKKKNLC